MPILHTIPIDSFPFTINVEGKNFQISNFPELAKVCLAATDADIRDVVRVQPKKTLIQSLVYKLNHSKVDEEYSVLLEEMC